MRINLVFAFLICCSAVLAQEHTERPNNILFFLVDDMRYDAIGLLNDFFITPHIDQLVRDGVMFEQAIVTTSLCSPSRASILTGQYAHKHNVLDNNTLLPEGLATFPQVLQDAGYDTAFVGKWHMGGSSDDPRAGFNRWVSFRGQGPYTNPTFNIDGEHVPTEGYTTDLITDHAVDFLQQDRDAPFMLYVSHKAVHAPFTPPERHRGSYDDAEFPWPATMADTEENYAGKPEWVRKQRASWHGVDGLYDNATDMATFVREYSEALRAVDDSIGRLLATLREQNLLEDTLVVFTSDNGFQFGEHGLIDKRTMYKASIRVPLIVHCPGYAPADTRRNEVIANIDFAPTFIELAGANVPDSVQGRSFVGLLEGTVDTWRDAVLYEYFWERSFPQTPTVLGVRTKRYKFMQYHGIWDRYELYDMQEDPDETNNLLAPYIQRHEAGPLEMYIKQRAEEPVKSIFINLEEELNRLLVETGAAPEPNWRP